MKSYRIPYTQLVSLLADQKDRLNEDNITSPFENATDRLMSEAAGEYLKLFTKSIQRWRHDHGPDPFMRMLVIIGYPIKRMKITDYENLVCDLDDFSLRLSSFASYLLSELEDQLHWGECSVNVDESSEEVIITLGQDYRITRYYELSKAAATGTKIPAVLIPRVVNEVDDLEDVEHAFQGFVTSIFSQVESDAVRNELKKKLIDYISEKN